MRGRLAKTLMQAMTMTAAAAMVLALTGCVGGGSGGDGDGGEGGAAGAGGGAGGMENPPNVPYEGAIDPLPEGAEVDEQSYFPAPTGGVWRYRRQTANWQDPPPVTEGGESMMAPGEEENEWVMTTIVIIELPVDGEMSTVRQTIRQTFVLEPSDELVGPKLKFKRLEIDEREVGSERFVRELDRTYDPPYDLIVDTWRTGQFGNRLEENSVRLEQSVLSRGEEEPDEQGGLISLSVVTTSEHQVLPMEGMYRETIHQIDVVDDFTNMISRTYWVQQGVGIVQWQYRDTNNIIYTLTESNVEVMAPAEDGGEMPAE